jgi:signal transduction histidine kinase
MSGTQEKTAAADAGVETAKLCHDLRQYVSAGMMLAGPQDIAGLDAETRSRLETIARVFEGISELVEQQYVEHRHCGCVDLTVMARDCVEFTRLTSRVPIDLVACRPVVAWANASLLRRAVMNVLNNATRAAGVGGRVSVEVGRHGANAWVEVGDDGAGFGRIPSINGVGMAVVEAAVRSAHGRLVIQSGPFPGTRVRLCLPRQTAGKVTAP